MSLFPCNHRMCIIVKRRDCQEDMIISVTSRCLDTVTPEIWMNMFLWVSFNTDSLSRLESSSWLQSPSCAINTYLFLQTLPKCNISCHNYRDSTSESVDLDSTQPQELQWWPTENSSATRLQSHGNPPITSTHLAKKKPSWRRQYSVFQMSSHPRTEVRCLSPVYWTPRIGSTSSLAFHVLISASLPQLLYPYSKESLLSSPSIRPTYIMSEECADLTYPSP